MKFLGDVGLDTLSKLAKQKFIAAEDLSAIYVIINSTHRFVPRYEDVKVDEQAFR